jgi:hypothetical protein
MTKPCPVIRCTSRGYYGIYEVKNSSWIARLSEQNKVAFPDSRPSDGVKHFVITFHDSTFERLAAGMEAEAAERSDGDFFNRFFRSDQ